MTESNNTLELHRADHSATPNTSNSERLRANKRPVQLLLIPGLALLAITFGVPLGWLLVMSFNAYDSGIITQAFTLQSYAAFFTGDFYLKEVLNTLVVGSTVTALTLTLSYPIALFLLKTPSRFRGVLLALAIAPLLTSAVVRTFGWLVILGDNGVINQLLMEANIISSPLKLANNQIGVIISLTEILMPYMILSIYTGSARLTGTLEEAASTLGAGRVQRFSSVTLPLTMPGVVTGCLLVFVLAISAFVTPALIGGGRVFLMATEIYDQAVSELNWPFASAMAFLLIAVFGVVLVIYQRIMRRLEF